MRATTFLFFSCFFVGCGSGPAEEECQPTPWYADADGDGFGTGAPVQACDAPAGRVADNDDCDDASAEVNPDAVEVCGGIDEDCDGLIDDKDPNVQDKPTWYWDGDADGHGIATPFVIACTQPSGYAPFDDDCDDEDERFHPGAVEDDCTDPSDYNCDGSVGYVDVDGDGHPACDDCNDAEARAWNGATEVCDDVDNDCDGLTDDDDDSLRGEPPWYGDADGDGYGDEAVQERACDAPEGFVGTAGDCDDTNAAMHPATEWYPDDDGDGYGTSSGTTVVQCEEPTGYALYDTDCDDAEHTVNPGRTFDFEDAMDNDCDGSTDEDVGSETYTHADDIQSIWSSKCGPCHTTRGDGSLSLASSAYDDIVEVASDDVASMYLIKPGDPDYSYLWHKLSGTHVSVGGAGATMPASGTLSTTQRSTIQTWILEGAVE